MTWKPDYRVYWFMYTHFGKYWCNFKDFIGHPSDPKWIMWIVNHIPGYYPEWIDDN